VTRRASNSLFTYGTLQLPAVQLEKYRRLLEGSADVLPGYRIERLTIEDRDVMRLSGKAEHPIAVETGNPSDRIAGIVYQLDDAELAATDAYEVAPYTRVNVTLESGRRAFAYVCSPSA
jgi:gamma-glutamylcyclotransferase (GGCT)/AIG2-like uncharacterized protein YtfP